MTIPTSSIDDVRDYLVSAIATQVNDATVLIQLDPPGTWQPDDIIYIGQSVVQDATLEAFVGNGGAHWLLENYRVSVDIDVFRGGDDPVTTWKRANTLSNAVDTVVRTDPTLGGRVLRAYPAHVEFTSEFEQEHHGRHVTVHKEIAVTADW